MRGIESVLGYTFYVESSTFMVLRGRATEATPMKIEKFEDIEAQNSQKSAVVSRESNIRMRQTVRSVGTCVRR